jgi:hypothetical protein
MKRAAVVTALTLLTALVAAPAASAAAAQIVPIDDVSPLPAETALPECLDDTIGQQTGTETLDGQLVVTDKTFHFRGTNTLQYTVRFASGGTVTGTAVEHLSFNSVLGGAATQTTAVNERRTILDASGHAVGTVMIHALSHVTFRDANTNGQLDEGELAHSVDRFFFTCK